MNTPDVIVLIAHGSRRAAANDEVRALAQQLAAHCGLPALAGFMELAEPSIPAAIAQAVAQGAQRVQVLPYFLVSGRHLDEDIAEALAQARRDHPAVEIAQRPYLGAMPEVVGVLARALAFGQSGA